MTDYKSAHLAWLKATKTFSPQYASDYRSDISYLEIMTSLYSNPNVNQQIAEKFFVADKTWFRKAIAISKEIDKQVNLLEPTANSCWFVTIGFNHDTWTIEKCTKAIKNILGMDWIIKAKGNFELFREDGQHPHFHMLLETPKGGKNDVIDRIFRPKYIQSIVASKNYIDVKVALPCHDKYIYLDKTSEKLQYIELDKEWRKKNNIPDYEKNW